MQYIATDCSFYQTPTPTAAARNESKSGLIISIEKKNGGRPSDVFKNSPKTADHETPNRLEPNPGDLDFGNDIGVETNIIGVENADFT